MKQVLVYSVFLFILASCATAPKTCTPLTGGYDLVSSYEGECLRLAFKGEDLSGKCLGNLLVYERKKNRHHSIVFKARNPRGTIAFNGTPHRKTSKIYYVKVADVSNGKPSPEGHKDTGICDVEILPGENIRAICSANDSGGKMTAGEFKTTSRTVISCMEGLK